MRNNIKQTILTDSCIYMHEIRTAIINSKEYVVFVSLVMHYEYKVVKQTAGLHHVHLLFWNFLFNCIYIDAYCSCWVEINEVVRFDRLNAKHVIIKRYAFQLHISRNTDRYNHKVAKKFHRMVSIDTFPMGLIFGKESTEILKTLNRMVVTNYATIANQEFGSKVKIHTFKLSPFYAVLQFHIVHYYSKPLNVND